MFGTVARFSLKPGMEERLDQLMKEYEQIKIPGNVATYLYKMDSDPSEHYLATIFDSRESYLANANSPEQESRYRKLLDVMTNEPEWHDGEIVYSGVFSRSAAF